MKKILIIALIIIISSLVYVSFLHKKTASITLLVVPSTASTTINGNSFQNGQINLSPGRYTLKASMPGFKSQTMIFTLKKNQKKVVGFVLTPDSSKTQNYYYVHPDQELLSEALADNLNIQNTNQTLKNEPIVKFLPHNGPLYTYTINYANNPKNPFEPFIQITANNPLYVDNALNWIESKGYQPNNLNLQFINQQPQIKL